MPIRRETTDQVTTSEELLKRLGRGEVSIRLMNAVREANGRLQLLQSLGGKNPKAKVMLELTIEPAAEPGSLAYTGRVKSTLPDVPVAPTVLYSEITTGRLARTPFEGDQDDYEKEESSQQ